MKLEVPALVVISLKVKTAQFVLPEKIKQKGASLTLLFLDPLHIGSSTRSSSVEGLPMEACVYFLQSLKISLSYISEILWSFYSWILCFSIKCSSGELDDLLQEYSILDYEQKCKSKIMHIFFLPKKTSSLSKVPCENIGQAI